MTGPRGGRSFDRHEAISDRPGLEAPSGLVVVLVSTSAAGRCFVGVVRRGRRTYGVVLPNSFDPGRQASKLLDAAFATVAVTPLFGPDTAGVDAAT